MNLWWFLAIVLTISAVFLLIMALFSRAVVEGLTAFFAKIVNKERKGGK